MAGRKLAIQFGLLNIAARSEVAIEKQASEDMINVCVGQPGKEGHDALPLKAPKSCTSCGLITDYAVLKKGVKQGRAYALVEQEDVAEAKNDYAKLYKDVLNLIPHPAQQFLNDTAPGDTLHFLTPEDASGANHYQLLVKLIESHPEYAFASLYTPVSATSLYMVRVREGVLVMEKRVRSQAVKATPSVGGEVSDVWYAALEGMLPTLVTDYDAEAYEDKFQTALAKMMAAAEQVLIAGADETKRTAPSLHTDADLLAKMQALSAMQGAAA